MTAPVKTFQIVSFGCKVNQAEGLALASRLRERGLCEATPEDEADLTIINTCTVTAEAARQGRQRVRQAVRSGAAVIVTGCGAHRAVRDERLREIDGVHLVEADKARVVESLRHDGALAAALARRTSSRARAGQAPRLTTTRSRAMLKVHDGCPASCTYCIVPKVRPVARSTPPDEAVRQLEELVVEGYREVVICGIHLGLYGADLGQTVTLVDLLERFLSVRGLGRLRLSSIEPMEVSDQLLALTQRDPDRLCPHLHIPLQSGDDEVLRRMNRPYTSRDFLAVVKRIREALPHPAVTTDVLVGFPGETDEAFARTLRVCRYAAFSRIHVFPFSARPGTRAAEMTDQVPREIIRARRQTASALGEELAAAYRDSLLGRTARVVLETIHPDGSAEGLPERYVRVHVRAPLPDRAARRGIIPVRLLRAAGDALEAEAM